MSHGLKAALYLFSSLLVGHVNIYFGSCTSAVNSGDGAFTIRHAVSGRCLVADKQQHLLVAECGGAQAEFWKWGSERRLYHTASARCLGLELRNKALRLLDCGDTGDMLWWRCADGTVYTEYQMALTVASDAVTARRSTADQWTRDESAESICDVPYQVVHTTLGNSYGEPCSFPFHYNGSWHHGCIPDDPSLPGDGLSWCSTTANYDVDKKRGYCLMPERGCGVLWEGRDREHCYQRNLQAAVTWHAARASCHSQGGDLLSISSTEELAFFTDKEDTPGQVWIGLEQLDLAQGWQWSDGSPLTLVLWDMGMPETAVLNSSDCAVMNPRGSWESVDCGKKLPYICKKNLNETDSDSDGLWIDQPTTCDEGWAAWNGFCYRLEGEQQPRAMQQALQHCEEMGASLLSMHSLAQVEALSSTLHANSSTEVWTGLHSHGEPTVFQWVDQSPVTFTYWARNEPRPLPLQGSNGTCVSYSDKVALRRAARGDILLGPVPAAPTHLWRVTPCDTALPFVCAKRGRVNESVVMAECLAREGWRRHGRACYRVDTKEVLFKDRCNVTIMSRFEQAFINSLLREHLMPESKFFWIGLQDVKNTGEYQWVADGGPVDRVTYTNWHAFQPEMAGGCAVLTTSRPLGKWQAKNCTSFKAGSICKMEIGPHVAPEPEPDLSLPCPPGWVSTPKVHYCYKVFHEERLSLKRTWEEAEHFCQALGAHLPSFSHVDEMKSLHGILRDSISNDRYFWIGLNRRNPGAQNTWEWSDGRPVSSSVFPSAFHEDDEYDRDCAAFKTQVRSLKALIFVLTHSLPLRSFYSSPFHCDARLEWVCQIPRGKTPEVPEWYNPGGHHESSIFVDGSEFWFVNETRLTHDEARLYCLSNDSKLAAPKTLNAIRQIFARLSKISDPRQSWWVDISDPSRHYPVTLYQMIYYRSIFLGTCSSISTKVMGPEYHHSCKKALPFVCEKLDPTSVEKNPVKPHPPGLPCDDKSLAFKDKCYTVFRPLHLSFSKASEHCHTMRGTLVTISSQVEQDFITSVLPNQPSKSWIGLKLKVQETQWVDGSPVTFLNFNPLLVGQQRPLLVNAFDPESIEMCVYQFNDHLSVVGTWDYVSCRETLPVAVCQHYADKPEEPSVPEGNVDVGNHTYKILQGNLTWAEALNQCRIQEMDLASVSDAFQQASLSVIVSRANMSMWIGLVSRDDGIHYHWTDNSHTLFSRWSSDSVLGSCIYLDTDGFWKATECEDELAGAICHIPHNETSTAPEEVTVKCPHKGGGLNWIPFRNNCYAFQLAYSRWGDPGTNVSNTCRKSYDKADVLTIRDEAENSFVQQQLLPFKDLVQYVWLGMVKDDDSGSLKWLDGTNVQYSNWRQGRPNITKPFMAGLTLDGFWKMFTIPNLFSTFKESSIVACKIENDSKDEFRKSANDTAPFRQWRYYVIQGKMTWFEAVRACGSAGGHLASVHSLAQEEHLGLVSRRDGFPLWIGLSSQDERGLLFEWSDGTSYDYKPQGMLDWSPEGGCVSLSPRGSWVRLSCQNRLEGAICYNSSTHMSNRQSVPLSRVCPPGVSDAEWLQQGEHCYALHAALFNYSVYTMEDARGVCAQLDKSAELLTITDSKENDFVSRYVLENPFVTSRVWLSTNLTSQGQPVEGSGTYSNWEKGTEEADPTEPVCGVLVSAKGGAWDRVSCQEGRGRAVCKAPVRSLGSPLALIIFSIIVLVLVVAVVFIMYRRNRYRFSSTVRYKRNFDEADSTSIITQAE